MSSPNRPTRLVPGIHPRTLLFLIVWVLFSAAGPLLSAGNPLRMGLVDAAHLHRVVLTIQVYVLIFFFPLLLSCRDVFYKRLSDESGLFEEDDENREAAPPDDFARGVRYLLFTLVLFLSGCPFVYIAGEIANVSVFRLIPGQFQVVGLMLGIGGIWWGAGSMNKGWVRYLFLVLVCLAVVGPLMYVGLIQIVGVEASWILLISPINAAFHMDGVYGVDPRVVQGVMNVTIGSLIGGVWFALRRYVWDAS